ncbi:MAG: putative transposase [Cyclobacteriaceae bacterium]|jgi:hypothetical protein
MIVSSKSNLSDIFRDFKKFTTKKIIREIDLINESRKEWLIRAFVKSADKVKRVQKPQNLARWQSPHSVGFK